MGIVGLHDPSHTFSLYACSVWVAILLVVPTLDHKVPSSSPAGGSSSYIAAEDKRDIQIIFSYFSTKT